MDFAMVAFHNNAVSPLINCIILCLFKVLFLCFDFAINAIFT